MRNIFVTGESSCAETTGNILAQCLCVQLARFIPGVFLTLARRRSLRGMNREGRQGDPMQGSRRASRDSKSSARIYATDKFDRSFQSYSILSNRRP